MLLHLMSADVYFIGEASPMLCRWHRGCVDEVSLNKNNESLVLLGEVRQALGDARQSWEKHNQSFSDLLYVIRVNGYTLLFQNWRANRQPFAEQ